MALRTIARFRSTRGLQLQTSAKIWQDARKVYACSYSAHASTSAGIHEEEKSETSVILSDNKGGQELENVVQLEQSKETQFKASIQVRFNYIPYILGPRYTKLKNIERVTNARIDVQHLKDLTRNADLVVNGASQESVDQAIAKIKAAFQRVIIFLGFISHLLGK
ncbi:hypothetical protein L7F22_034852 [Adiantum nelumboides]|nr:hypothetical protein [Adiantum nelumboides]